jgi:hypothetical protein
MGAGPFQEPSLTQLWSTVDDLLRRTLDAIPRELLDGDASPADEIDVGALFDRDDDWRAAQHSLILLGGLLADEFGSIRISAPMEFSSSIVLRLRVAVPSLAASELIARFPPMVEALFREVAPGASPVVTATPAEGDP